MLTTGLYYPLTVTPSGDIQPASTDTEELIASYARYLLDTEAPISVFEAVGSDVTAEQLQRFSYALRTKAPLLQFAITARWESRTLLIDIRWTESGVDGATTVVVGGG